MEGRSAAEVLEVHGTGRVTTDQGRAGGTRKPSGVIGSQRSQVEPRWRGAKAELTARQAEVELLGGSSGLTIQGESKQMGGAGVGGAKGL